MLSLISHLFTTWKAVHYQVHFIPKTPYKDWKSYFSHRNKNMNLQQSSIGSLLSYFLKKYGKWRREPIPLPWIVSKPSRDCVFHRTALPIAVPHKYTTFPSWTANPNESVQLWLLDLIFGGIASILSYKHIREILHLNNAWTIIVAVNKSDLLFPYSRMWNYFQGT